MALKAGSAVFSAITASALADNHRQARGSMPALSKVIESAAGVRLRWMLDVAGNARTGAAEECPDADLVLRDGTFNDAPALSQRSSGTREAGVVVKTSPEVVDAVVYGRPECEAVEKEVVAAGLDCGGAGYPSAEVPPASVKAATYETSIKVCADWASHPIGGYGTAPRT